MDRRNPSDDKRRAIEGILGSPRKEEDQQEPEEEVIEVEADEYNATGIGMTSVEEEEEEFVQEQKPNRTPAIIITAAILLIGILATTLILARDQIYGMFAGIEKYDRSDTDNSEEVNALKAEISDLQLSLKGNEDALVELENLRKANKTLQASFETERNRADEIQKELDGILSGEIENPGFSAKLEEAREEIKTLKDDLTKAQAESSRLETDLDNTQKRMVSYSQENSRLNEELSDVKSQLTKYSRLKRENERIRNERDSLSRDLRAARSQIQVLQGSAEKDADKTLQDVNDEYRRVLDLLKESRDANNTKQSRIDELLAENSRMQQELSRYQKRTTQRSDQLAQVRSGGSSYSTTGPTATKIVRPKYPNSAMQRGVSGTVRLRILISESGKVIDAQVVSSPDPMRALDRAALRAVKQWQFSPARRAGKAVRVWHNVPMEFNLKRDDE